MAYTVASIDTRYIDSNLESGRYISRVGRASRFISLRLLPLDASVHQYRLAPIDSLGQFIEEVPQMIRQMPALEADLGSIQVNFEEVPIQNGLNARHESNWWVGMIPRRP